LLQHQQPALDGSDRRSRDVAVIGLESLGVIADVLQHRAEVLEVEQQHAVVVGDLEHDRQDALLRLVEVEHARQQQRAQIGDGGSHRVALFAEDVPEHDRTSSVAWFVETKALQALEEFGRRGARPGDAGQVSLHVGHEDRNADAGERLGHHLEGHGLRGSGITWRQKA
jgi:hypothetical protein